MSVISEEAVKAALNAWTNYTNSGPVRADWRDAMEVALTAALPHLPGVGVKKLAWIRPPLSGTLSRCDTDFGTYRTWTHGEANGKWFWSVEGGWNEANGEALNEEAAKAAAQADYSARILSELEPSAARKELLKQIREGTAHGFLNDGSQPEGNPDLDCPYCCGSGHKGDVHPSAARELALEEAAPVADELEERTKLKYASPDGEECQIVPLVLLIEAAAAIRALGTSCEQLNKAVSNVPDQQENEPGAHGEREMVLEEAAHNAAMYLATGFISCPRCGEDVETKNTDAEYTLRAALRERE